jgi:hypothetical protein
MADDITLGMTRRKMNRFLAAHGVDVSGEERLEELREKVRAVIQTAANEIAEQGEEWSD